VSQAIIFAVQGYASRGVGDDAQLDYSVAASEHVSVNWKSFADFSRAEAVHSD